MCARSLLHPRQQTVFHICQHLFDIKPLRKLPMCTLTPRVNSASATHHACSMYCLFVLEIVAQCAWALGSPSSQDNSSFILACLIINDAKNLSVWGVCDRSYCFANVLLSLVESKRAKSYFYVMLRMDNSIVRDVMIVRRLYSILEFCTHWHERGWRIE